MEDHIIHKYTERINSGCFVINKTAHIPTITTDFNWLILSTILLLKCDTASTCNVLTGYLCYTEYYRHCRVRSSLSLSLTCHTNQSAHLSLHLHESHIRNISHYTGTAGLSSPSEFAVSIFNLQTRVQTN